MDDNFISAECRLDGVKRTYEYQVRWFPSGDGFFWHAVIGCGSQIKANPWGALKSVPGADIKKRVVTAVEQSIQNLESARKFAEVES
jgi:hypothetical protein